MWMYVIILAADGRWLWKCSLHTSSKALHRNRKWRPACEVESQQQQQSAAALVAGMPRLPRANQRSSSTRRLTSVTYRRWTGPTYNTVLASCGRCTDVRSYRWRQSDVKWTSRLAVDVSRRLIDDNLTYLCYLGYGHSRMLGAYGTPILGEGEVVGGQRWHH